MHKITHNSMKHKGSTLILTISVGVHPRNIHTKFEANPFNGLRKEVEKLKKLMPTMKRRQRQQRRQTQGDRCSHTHSLSVTKNYIRCILFNKYVIHQLFLSAIKGPFNFSGMLFVWLNITVKKQHHVSEKKTVTNNDGK